MAEAMLSDDLRSSPIPDLQLQVEKPKRKSEELIETKAIDTKEATPQADRRKVVQIKLPPKRPKLSQTVTAKQVIDAISVSVSPQERIHALSEALLSFGHNIQCAHDEELATGADAIMTKHLGYLLFAKHRLEEMPRGNVDGSDVSTEISQACEILELLYRGSVDAVSKSFDRISQELLPLLICIIDNEVSCRYTNEEEKAGEEEKNATTDLQDVVSEGDSESNWEDKMAAVEAVDERRSVTPPSPQIQDSSQQGRDEGSLTLRKATKILGHFARVEGATQRLAFHPGLLSSLINIITFTPYEMIPAEARLNSLWIIGNLACNADCMVNMACHPGLLDTLVMASVRTSHEHDPIEVKMEVIRSHSIAARALHNLAWAPENKIPMSENQNLVEALATMVVHRDSPLGVRMRGVGDNIQSRLHAVSALRQLAFAPRRNKIRLCRHGGGKILDNLTDAALNDPNDGIVEKALAALHTLACVDTAEMMMDRPALLSLLENTMLSEDVSKGDGSRGKSEASGTLLILERSITEDMPSYNTLREILNRLQPPEEEKDGEFGETDEVESSMPMPAQKFKSEY